MMKYIQTKSFIVFLFCLLTGILIYSDKDRKHLSKNQNGDQFSEETIENRIPLQDRIDLAWQQEYELTKDPVTKTVPVERLLAGYDQIKQRLSQNVNGKVLGAIPGITWVERGPNNCGGRTRAIMVDPNDITKKKVWAAGIGGGLWYTNDITVSSPVWNKVDDLLANIGISSIVFNPVNKQIMYFGTGEGWLNADSQRGLGIWKTSDGGATWIQLSSTNNSNFYHVQRMAVHPVTGDVYAATKTGLRRSQDGGVTWTQVLGSGNGSMSSNISDVEIAPNNSIWVGVGIFSTDGVYRSTTGNTGTWSKLNTGTNGFPTTGIQRIELACAPSNAQVAYAAVQDGAYALLNIYKTTDGGATWVTCSKPDDADGGIPASDFTRGQAWYDFSLAVDPNNSNNVVAGGVDLFKTTVGGTGAGAWQQISHWYGGFGFQNVHADQHWAYYEPGNSSVIYFGNDGGVWRTTNGTAVIPTITNKNSGYNVTQFYSCAIHPTANTNYFLAGAQDNGSHRFNSAGMNSTVQVTGGDGCLMHIDQDQPQYQWTSYVYNNYFRSINGGTGWTTVNFGNTGSFVNPTDYDNVTNVMYCCISSGNYMRWTNPQTGNTTATINITNFGTGNVTHISVSQNTPNKVFFGLNNGRVVRVDNANTATSGTAGTWINNGAGMPGGSVSCIAVENGNDNHLLVTYSAYGVSSVWETTNGGTSWANLDNASLPDMPVRWALFNPLNNTQAMIATELGVWSTDMISGAATNWAPSNSGLANTRVSMLQIRSSDNMVVASTHGRGLFTSDVFAPPNPDFVADKRVRYTAKPIQFTDASTKSTSWYWNFGDGTNSTVKNPVKSYNTPGIYTVSLQINGTAAYTATKISYIQILPNRGTPYTPAAGGNFEVSTGDFGAENIAGTAWQRGNSGVAGKNGVNGGSNAWVTGLSGNYTDNTDARLMTPNYNFTTPGTYTVRFYRKNSFEIPWDGFRVEYTLDKGDTWTILGTVAAGWYDFANSVQNTSFPINEPFFNATVSNYTLASWNASALFGNSNVAFRIVFKSDVNTVAPGVAIDDFEIIGPSNSPLPVELISFTGKDEKDFNLLNWKTASEINNNGFDVERSATGAVFEKISFIKGAGNSTQINNYKFEDRDIEHNISYYRLKQVDFNGDSQYSNIIAVRRNSDQAGIEFIFPNPFDDEINLVMTGEFDIPVLVRLLDLGGKKLYENNISIDNYQTTVNFSSLNLSQGTYFLFLIADKKVFTQKLFKK